MLYYLFAFLDKTYDLAGAGVFRYISFRAIAAIVLSLVITLVFGRRLILMLVRRQVGETIRDLPIPGQKQKEGTPTMGGIIIILGILLPTLLFARLDNVYVILLIISTIWLGLIGFLDDYIKVFKKDKKGLHGRFKVIGQVGLGLIVGLTLYFNESVKVREYTNFNVNVEAKGHESFARKLDNMADASFQYEDVRNTSTTVPFMKNNELVYDKLFKFLGDFSWIGYVLVVIFIITAVSNGANITDGMDGLAAGVSAIIGLTLGILAYVSGNTIFAQYLGIMYIPQSGELVVFCAAFVGACVGFLWYNSFPAQVFMGDTGSLALGGIIAVLSFAIRKELMLPLICGIFLVENLSVMIQVSYFKYTKKRFGEGRRIFKMSPLHHHYQLLGYHESKIVNRFWIIGIIIAVVALGTLKLR
jgi:phospho-N-acetylmuramoyl-pentapeptide-transferase